MPLRCAGFRATRNIELKSSSLSSVVKKCSSDDADDESNSGRPCLGKGLRPCNNEDNCELGEWREGPDGCALVAVHSQTSTSSEADCSPPPGAPTRPRQFLSPLLELCNLASRSRVSGWGGGTHPRRGRGSESLSSQPDSLGVDDCGDLPSTEDIKEVGIERDVVDPRRISGATEAGGVSEGALEGKTRCKSPFRESLLSGSDGAGCDGAAALGSVSALYISFLDEVKSRRHVARSSRHVF